MINLLQIQDDLKNFSEDQLVREMQQPSGTAPQFLVLSELNRRKRVKGEFAARQAQQSPTVAEEVVAAAGVPQSGIAGMAEAMAPASSASEGIGTNAPINMRSGGLAQFGNEIRESMGQEIDPYLDQIENEAESKFNINLDNQIMRRPEAQTRPANPISYFNRPGYRGPTYMDRGGVRRPLNIPMRRGIGGKGGGLMAIPEPAVLTEDLRNRSSFVPSYAEGGVIRAQSGLPEDEIVDTSFDSDFDTQGGSQMMPMGINQKLNLTSDDDVLDIEQELRNRQASIESDRNFARNMALVQAGLGILASDKPTLAQAVGEGGQQGLTALTDANQKYQEGLTDVLNARSKLQQARIKATGRGTLDRKGALAAISSYNNDIAAIRKQISDVSTSYEGDPREIPQKLAALEEELNRLRFEQSQLYDAAGIRPRPKIKVADLPSSTKSG